MSRIRITQHYTQNGGGENRAVGPAGAGSAHVGPHWVLFVLDVKPAQWLLANDHELPEDLAALAEEVSEG